MNDESSQRLIRELTADLQPVAPFPSLPALVASTVLLWGALGAFVLLALGPRADLSPILREDPAYAAVVLGLIIAAVGATLATFAAAVPGRESLRLGALAAAVSGMVIAGWTCLSSPTASVPGDLASDLVCVGYAALLALPLVGWISLRALRGFIQEPPRVAVISLFAAVAMGALIVHLICPAGASSHFLTAHLGAAPLVSLLGAVPLALLLRRASQ